MTSAPRTFRLPPVVARDLRDYVPALEECAAAAGIDPVLFLTNTDDPEIERWTKRLPMAEFIVGYLHCLCAAIGTSMRPLWSALQAEFGDPGERPRRRRSAGDRELAGETGRKRLPAKATEARTFARAVLALPAGAPPPDELDRPETLPGPGGQRVTVPSADDDQPGKRAKRRRKAHDQQGRLPLS